MQLRSLLEQFFINSFLLLLLIVLLLHLRPVDHWQIILEEWLLVDRDMREVEVLLFWLVHYVLSYYN